MSYKILALVSGLNKNDIIENGKIVERQTEKGEILEVQSVDLSELRSRYYKIIKDNNMAPTIKRERTPAPVEDKGAQVEQLSDLIIQLQAVIKTAQAALGNLVLEKSPAVIAKPEIEPPVQEIMDHLTFQAEKNIDPVLQEFMIDEQQAEVEATEIFSEQDFKKQNSAYSNVLFNTLAGQISGVRDIVAFSAYENKKLPTVSEAKLGKISDTITEDGPVLFDAAGNPVGKSAEKINLIVAKDGRIDVEKTLGFKLMNAPGNRTEA